ncbi:hypothetical protein vseg_004942 [Gypsophila vaccaria]
MRRENKGAYYRNLGWVMIVPCTSKKALLRTNSQRGIGEMLSTKLATIVEEPETEGSYDRPVDQVRYNNPSKAKVYDNNRKLLSLFKGKMIGKDLIRSNKLFKKSRVMISRNICVKGSYINFLAGFVAKGSLTGLPRY